MCFKGTRATLLLFSLALLLSSCSLSMKRVALSERNAETLAMQLANQEARRRFKVEPFETESGYLIFATNGWIWQALTSHGGYDAVAKVSFDRLGGMRHVEVDLQSSGVLGLPIQKRILENEANPTPLPEVVR